MNAVADDSVVAASAATNSLDGAIERACARVAPNWPLDQLIAVNPLWGWVDEPFARVLAKLQALAGSRLLMPRAWYAEQFRAGRFSERHLDIACARLSPDTNRADLVAALRAPEATPPVRELVSDCADRLHDHGKHPAWSAFITHAISQHCAAYFDDGQAAIHPPRQAGLYGTWRRHAASDHTPRLSMGLRGFRRRAKQLPEQPRELIRAALPALGVDSGQWEDYLCALLLSINGWAAWCAYHAWQAQLTGANDEQLIELLAIRLAWEWLLHDSHAPRLIDAWCAARHAWPACDAQATSSLATDRLLQEALEIAYHESLARVLAAASPARRNAEPAAQLVFCIDVRSEVFRRALEAADERVETRGFAGFFGLAAEYRPLAAASSRPQLPGLFAPRYVIEEDDSDAALVARRRRELQHGEAWRGLRASPLAMFGFVEGAGLAYAGKLVASARAGGADMYRNEAAARKPRMIRTRDGAAIPCAERIAVAENALRAMSLTRDFGRLLVLVAHASATTNNPLAGALDCGACGGHSGEVNARAMAALLNDPEVRNGLSRRGIVLPEHTHVLAALHVTTTDDVVLFDADQVPASHRADVAQLDARLVDAARRSRAERALRLGVPVHSDALTHRAMQRRARDASELRPEWGLANCAALVVAQREHCRNADFAGRAFLHEYQWRNDADLAILTGILIAPMVVAHWINLQYYASTVDNRKFGSGNKTLHNVVGGRIGVFEGNGGDLRIGLPLQSLHDGHKWMHEPLRLTVVIDAPTDAIDTVLSRAATVARLVDNGWLHLFRWDTDARALWQRAPRGGWSEWQTG